MSTPEVTLDLVRPERIGLAEAIYCPGKSREHLEDIIDTVRGRPVATLFTRLAPEQLAALSDGHRAALEYDPVSRTALAGPPPVPDGPARVAIVSAGTSDVPVAREAARTLLASGRAATLVTDVGVAGLWRLLDRLELIRRHPVIIVVAGMDAALPSVVGGLVAGVVIAVPTSTGYGVAAHGQSALNAALASCAPGVTVLNVDNGYGAGCAAVRVLNAIEGRAGAASPTAG